MTCSVETCSPGGVSAKEETYGGRGGEDSGGFLNLWDTLLESAPYFGPLRMIS